MAADEPAGVSVGAALAAARESHRRSVEDVSAATRIRAGLIRAIEADEFSSCGGAVYARGHIRSIAAVLGIDSAPLITQFDRLHGGPPMAGRVADPLPGPIPGGGVLRRRPAGEFGPQAGGTQPSGTVRGAGAGTGPAGARATPGGPAGSLIATAAGSSGRWPGRGPRAERSARSEVTARRQLTAPRGPNWMLAMGVALLVVIVLAAVSLVSSPASHTGPQAQRPAAGERSARSPKPRPTVTATSAPSNSVADAGVNVAVRLLSAPSWVHVQDQSGHLLFQGILSAGTSQQFHASQQLAFVIGNAGAVDVTVNGHDLGVLGPSGSVRNPVFTAGSTTVG